MGLRESLGVRTPGEGERPMSRMMRISRPALVALTAIAFSAATQAMTDDQATDESTPVLLAGNPGDLGPVSFGGDARMGDTPCNQADFVEPFGTLNFFDVLEFLELFTSGDMAADVAGDGILDFHDIAIFLSAFSAGCP
jgi:hypothetical protein